MAKQPEVLLNTFVQRLEDVISAYVVMCELKGKEALTSGEWAEDFSEFLENEV